MEAPTATDSGNDAENPTGLPPSFPTAQTTSVLSLTIEDAGVLDRHRDVVAYRAGPRAGDDVSVQGGVSDRVGNPGVGGEVVSVEHLDR